MRSVKNNSYASALIASDDVMSFIIKTRKGIEQALFDQSDLLVMIDARCRILSINPKGKEALADPQHFLKRLHDILDDELVAPIEKGIGLIDADQATAEFEGTLNTFNTPRHFRFTLKALPGISERRGRVFTLSGVDITTIKSLYHDLLEKDQELEFYVSELEKLIETVKTQKVKIEEANRLAQLGEMAGGIAHEINNPMQIIQMSAELLVQRLLKKGITDQDLRSRLNTITETCERVTKVISSMRSLAHNGSKEDFAECYMFEIFSAATVFFRQKLRSEGVNLTVDCPKEIKLLCSPTQIAQVIVNVINNSYNALQEQPHKNAWINISSFEDTSWIKIRISDSGPGLQGDAIKKWAQPFFTTKEVGKGMGLGLSIVRAILEKHHGQISYLHKEPQTTFEIRLPRQTKT